RRTDHEQRNCRYTESLLCTCLVADVLRLPTIIRYRGIASHATAAYRTMIANNLLGRIMTSLKDQTDAQIEKTRQAKPDFMNSVDELLAAAKDFEQGGSATTVGETAPTFELPNAQGKIVSLADLLKNGPVVVTFYRGNWCPYCNLQLRAMQQRLDEIHNLGAELVAISPQKPDESLSQAERDELDFIVLSDQDAQVAEQYGIAWQVPDVLIEHMKKDRGLELAKINNGNGSVLPIPATFVLSNDGVVTWRYANVDYRTRAEPDDIIAALQKLSIPAPK
ncbi:peroxiredoxin-like family protein, partial [Aporhodopirellula aestuarii]